MRALASSARGPASSRCRGRSIPVWGLVIALGAALPALARAQAELGDGLPSEAPAAAVPAAAALPTEPGPRVACPCAPDPTASLRFAQELLASGDAYRAIGEFKRFVFEQPEHPAVPAARMGIAAAYRQGKRFEHAANAYLEVLRLHPGSADAAHATFLAAECYYQAFEYGPAETHYLGYLERFPEGADADLARYRLAWTHIGRHDFRAAALSLAEAPPGGRYAPAAANLAGRLAGAEALPRKRRWLAGLLSAALPGAGQLYAGRSGDAVLSFVVNGVFAFGTYEALRQETYTAAGLMGLFSLGFYLGNVYGALNAAERENQVITERYVSGLVQDLEQPQLSWRPVVPQPALALTLPALRLSW